MYDRILATIADLSMRSGRGPIGAVDPEAVLTEVRAARSAFVASVKQLEKDGLLTIDLDTGFLSLTEAGVRRVELGGGRSNGEE